jgi:hypothetical protein
MERGAVGVSGNGQDDLGTVVTVVAAVPIACEGRGNGAFEVDVGEVLGGETDGLFECVDCKFFSKGHQ